MIKKLNTTELKPFTHVEILKINENDCADCEAIQMSEDETQEIYREKNVSFSSGIWPFELTDEEKEELKIKTYTEFEEV